MLTAEIQPLLNAYGKDPLDEAVGDNVEFLGILVKNVTRTTTVTGDNIVMLFIVMDPVPGVVILF